MACGFASCLFWLRILGTDDRTNIGVGGGIEELQQQHPSRPLTNADEIDISHHQEEVDSSTLDDADIDMLLDADWEKEIFRTKKYPFVSDLARKSYRALSRKLTLYHWNLWTIAIFYRSESG